MGLGSIDLYLDNVSFESKGINPDSDINNNNIPKTITGVKHVKPGSQTVKTTTSVVASKILGEMTEVQRIGFLTDLRN